MSLLFRLPPKKNRRAPRAVMVLGGCRSGKTSWAEEQALTRAKGAARAGAPVYLATARAAADDASMRERIAKHRASRSEIWRTVELEESARLSETLAALFSESPAPAAVLIDCLAGWLSELMLGGLKQEVILERVDDLAQCLKQRACPVFLVCNETGLGVSPATSLGNEFRDINGLANQKLAKNCDEVYFIVSGQSLKIKCGSAKR